MQVLAPVTLRSPSVRDDAEAGYAAGDFWHRPGPGFPLMVCADATPGRAKWHVFPAAAPPPADAIMAAGGGGPPLAAWGVRRLVCAYGTGPAFDVTNARSGASRRIHFLADGSADWSAYFAFTANGGGRITAWYDQSGRANHLTGPLESAPTIAPANGWQGNHPVVFDAQREGRQVDRFLTLPPSLAADSQALSALMLGSCRCTANQVNLLSLLNPNANLVLKFDNGGGNFGLLYRSSFMLPQLLPTTPFVAGFSAGRSSIEVWLDQTSRSFGATGPAMLAGGYLGAAPRTTGTSGYCDVFGAMIFGRALSQAEIAAGNAAFYREFALSPQVRDFALFDGDSITQSFLALNNMSWPRQVAELLEVPMRVYNTGAFGQTAKQRAAAFASLGAKAYQPKARHAIYQLFAGTNDLTSNRGGEAIYEEGHAAWMRTARALGPNVRAGLVTVLPRAGFAASLNPAGGTHETQRLALNARILENRAGAAFLVDLAGDNLLGSASAYANGLFPDGVHPGPVAQAHQAAIVAGAVNAALREPM